MASNVEFVEYVSEQLSDAGTITFRKMFGEYGLYCNGIFFACICDNRLFIKITEAGSAVLQNPALAPPYDGAKPYFLIEEVENRTLLCRLTAVTCAALPPPKPKQKKPARTFELLL